MTTTTADILRETLRNIEVCYDLEDFTTPLLKHLNWMLENRIFDVKRGATFEARQVTFQVQANGPYNDREASVKLSNPSILVYGTMTYNDREDKSATVEVTPRHAWTRATAWNGTKWDDLPEGARRRVADAVEAAVKEEIDEHRWRIVGDEAYRGKQESSIRGRLADALREAEKALDVLNQEVSW